LSGGVDQNGLGRGGITKKGSKSSAGEVWGGDSAETVPREGGGRGDRPQ